MRSLPFLAIPIGLVLVSVVTGITAIFDESPTSLFIGLGAIIALWAYVRRFHDRFLNL